MNLTCNEAPEALGHLEYTTPGQGYNIVFTETSPLIVSSIIRKGQDFSQGFWLHEIIDYGNILKQNYELFGKVAALTLVTIANCTPEENLEF